MMSRYFGMSSELSRAIAKNLGSFFNQFVTDGSMALASSELRQICRLTMEL